MEEFLERIDREEIEIDWSKMLAGIPRSVYDDVDER